MDDRSAEQMGHPADPHQREPSRADGMAARHATGEKTDSDECERGSVDGKGLPAVPTGRVHRARASRCDVTSAANVTTGPLACGGPDALRSAVPATQGAME